MGLWVRIVRINIYDSFVDGDDAIPEITLVLVMCE